MKKDEQVLTAETGDISIHTENILPIIKKWLYADHEIFLRELVSNGVDAITKIRHLQSVGEYKGNTDKARVRVSFDKDKKEIRVSDDGIGMTADEIKKYINQIAFSGAEEFVKTYRKDDVNSGIIGHFGLGFYSSFMVSDSVEIHTKSYTGAPAAHWISDGSTRFTIDSSDRKERGTEIILHIDKDNEDFLEAFKIREILNKYCKFLPVEVEFEGEVVNETHPTWVKTPSEVNEKEYKEFYQKLHPYQPDPLFWIHLNVDYPFRLTGILYFPKIQNEMDINKGQIQLYCQQVYVSNNVADVLPEFLTLLRGVIDSPDIPLNVSRSFLQNDRNVKKIAGHITKKIADKLNELSQSDRTAYESYWKDISPFVKYGMITDESFLDRVKDIALLATTEGTMQTVKEYVDANKESNKGEGDKTIVLYSSDANKQATYLEMVKEKGLKAVVLDHLIDNHFISAIERKDSNLKFVRVDANVVDKLINPNAITLEVNADQAKALEGVFKPVIRNQKMKIKVENLSSAEIPAKIIVTEESRRLKDMMRTMTIAQGKESTDDMFDDSTLIINVNNDITRKMLILEPTRPDLVKELAAHVYDLAAMAQAPLTGQEMSAFVKRMNKLLSLIS